jgi:hypothetical protein
MGYSTTIAAVVRKTTHLQFWPSQQFADIKWKSTRVHLRNTNAKLTTRHCQDYADK